jgi:hypothetical protein
MNYKYIGGVKMVVRFIVFIVLLIVFFLGSVILFEFGKLLSGLGGLGIFFIIFCLGLVGLTDYLTNRIYKKE